MANITNFLSCYSAKYK